MITDVFYVHWSSVLNCVRAWPLWHVGHVLLPSLRAWTRPLWLLYPMQQFFWIYSCPVEVFLVSKPNVCLHSVLLDKMCVFNLEVKQVFAFPASEVCKHAFTNQNVQVFWIMHCLHACTLASGLPAPCLCWHITAWRHLEFCETTRNTLPCIY